RLQAAPGGSDHYEVIGHLVDPSVELLAGIELLVPALVRAEADRLLVAESEEAEGRQALVEQSMHAVLQRSVEVDHHVAADDHVELVERSIGDEVVLREDE